MTYILVVHFYHPRYPRRGYGLHSIKTLIQLLIRVRRVQVRVPWSNYTLAESYALFLLYGYVVPPMNPWFILLAGQWLALRWHPHRSCELNRLDVFYFSHFVHFVAMWIWSFFLVFKFPIIGLFGNLSWAREGDLPPRSRAWMRTLSPRYQWYLAFA